MYPRLLELPWTVPLLGQITIYTYGVLLAAAYLLGLKLVLVVTDFRVFRADPAELLTLARSGGVFYGGLLLAVAVALWYIRRAGLPLWTTCDVFAPGIALGH